MRLTKLRVKNFRSIQDLDIELPNFCALVGPNNAGKSNFMEAVRRVLIYDWGPRVNQFSERDVHLREPDRDIEIACTFDPPIPYAKVKNTDPAQVHELKFTFTRYKIGPFKGQRRLVQECFGAQQKTLAVQKARDQAGKKREYEAVVGIPQEVREQVPIIYIAANRSLRDQLPSGRTSMLRQMLEDVDENFSQPAELVSVQRDGKQLELPRSERFRELLQEAMALLATKQFTDLEAAIKRNALAQLGLSDSDNLDLYFAPMTSMDFYRSLDIVIREGSFELSATEMGGGVQNAIVLAILKAFEETRRRGAIILIEEPEMFLHPQMQRSLYRTLKEIARVNQVIYTTHSPHFVSVPDYNEVLLVRKDGNGTHVATSALPTNAQRRERLIKELDPERNELFFARRLLLVEGDTEKLALPEYAKRMSVDLDRAGATIVEVGGKKNLMEFAAIAISFGIPTGVLYDRDGGSDFKDEKEEQEFNARLDALAKADGSVRVWQLVKKYEDHVRKKLGEAPYQALCTKFGGFTKPIRQRLIAMEVAVPVPEPFDEVLKWLGGIEAADEAEAFDDEPDDGMDDLFEHLD